MKKIFLMIFVFMTAINGFAEPLDRSIREIRDIISSPQLKRYIPPIERIIDIRRVERGYIITTDHFQLFVEIMYPMRGESGEEGRGTLQFHEPKETKK